MWLYDTPANPTIINALWVMEKVCMNTLYMGAKRQPFGIEIPINFTFEFRLVSKRVLSHRRPLHVMGEVARRAFNRLTSGMCAGCWRRGC
jgi:hypothetical protein